MCVKAFKRNIVATRILELTRYIIRITIMIEFLKRRNGLKGMSTISEAVQCNMINCTSDQKEQLGNQVFTKIN